MTRRRRGALTVYRGGGAPSSSPRGARRGVVAAVLAARVAIRARSRAGGSSRCGAWAVRVTGQRRTVWTVGPVSGRPRARSQRDSRPRTGGFSGESRRKAKRRRIAASRPSPRRAAPTPRRPACPTSPAAPSRPTSPVPTASSVSAAAAAPNSPRSSPQAASPCDGCREAARGLRRTGRRQAGPRSGGAAAGRGCGQEGFCSTVRARMPRVARRADSWRVGKIPAAR